MGEIAWRDDGLIGPCMVVVWSCMLFMHGCFVLHV